MSYADRNKILPSKGSQSCGETESEANNYKVICKRNHEDIIVMAITLNSIVNEKKACILDSVCVNLPFGSIQHIFKHLLCVGTFLVTKDT